MLSKTFSDEPLYTIASYRTPDMAPGDTQPEPGEYGMVIVPQNGKVFIACTLAVGKNLLKFLRLR